MNSSGPGPGYDPSDASVFLDNILYNGIGGVQEGVYNFSNGGFTGRSNSADGQGPPDDDQAAGELYRNVIQVLPPIEGQGTLWGRITNLATKSQRQTQIGESLYSVNHDGYLEKSTRFYQNAVPDEDIQMLFNPMKLGTAVKVTGNLFVRSWKFVKSWFRRGRKGGVSKYASRIRQRAVKDPGGHNFPFSFDAEILKTKPIPIRDGTRGYGYALRGTKNGSEVIYNIIVKDGVITHRDLIGIKKWKQRSKSFGWPLKLEDIPRIP